MEKKSEDLFLTHIKLSSCHFQGQKVEVIFFLMSAKESPLEGFPILSLSSNLISQYAFFDPSWMWHVVFPNTIYPFPLIPSTFISTYSNFPNSSEINSGSISIRKYIEINFFKIYCNALLHMKSNLIRYFFYGINFSLCLVQSKIPRCGDFSLLCSLYFVSY